MSRLLAAALAIVAMTVVLAACTREESKPAAKATAAPAKVATPAAPQAQASAGAAAEQVDELYVDLEADPDEGAPPLNVKFTSTVEDATPPLTYKWDFGDGSAASTDANPTHVYQKAGEYTATLSVKDSKGITGSEEVDILVEAE